MVVDKDTGEIISFLPQEEAEGTRFILDCSNNEDVKDMFPEEACGRVLWMNAAQDTLRESLSPEVRNYFEEVCSMIPAQNYLISAIQEMACHLGVKDKFTHRLVDQWKRVGLIKTLVKDHTKRGRHIFIFNPTIVWKGYIHKGASDHLDNVGYGSTYRFSSEHRKAVDAWVESYVTGKYKGVLLPVD